MQWVRPCCANIVSRIPHTQARLCRLSTKTPTVNPSGIERPREPHLRRNHTESGLAETLALPGGSLELDLGPEPNECLHNGKGAWTREGVNWFKEFWEALTVPMSRETAHTVESVGNFTPRAQQVLALARKEAERFQHNFVGAEHLLLGIIRLGQGVAVNVLARMGVDLGSARREIEKQIGKGPDQKVVGLVPYTPRVKKVLALAAKEARALNHTYVGTEHILLGLLREGDGVAANVLKNLKVNVQATRQEILRELDPNFQPPAAETDIVDTPALPDMPEPQPNTVDTCKRYDVYCVERDQEVVYRNVLFKGAKTLFPEVKPDVSSLFLELEQTDGQSVFVARYSVLKFCVHRAAPGPEASPGI